MTHPGCYNRPDVSREPMLWVQDGWHTEREFCNGDKAQTRRMVVIPNVFNDQKCVIDLIECGDCQWRQVK